MKEHEIQALEEAFGVAHIGDPNERRAEVERRLSKLNQLDRAAILMKIGTRARELDAKAPGAKYSPASWSLIATSGLCAILASLAGYAILGTEWSMAFKVSLTLLGLLWFFMAWRAIARVIFRLVKGRDV